MFERFFHCEELSRYLSRRKVSDVAGKACSAESALERTSDLSGYAGRQSVVLTKQHGFDAVSVTELPEIFSCSVN